MVRDFCPLFFLVKCKVCAGKDAPLDRTFGELYRATDEEGGGWKYRPKVRRRDRGRTKHVDLVGQFQLSGVVHLCCRSCNHKPTPTVTSLGSLAEKAQRNGVAYIYV